MTEYNVTLTTVVEVENDDQIDQAIKQEIAGGFYVIRKVEDVAP